jgi:hypothetical protein
MSKKCHELRLAKNVMSRDFREWKSSCTEYCTVLGEKVQGYKAMA